MEIFPLEIWQIFHFTEFCEFWGITRLQQLHSNANTAWVKPVELPPAWQVYMETNFLLTFQSSL